MSSPEPYRLSYKPDSRLPRILHVNGNFIIGGTSQLIVDIIERTSEKYFHEVIVPDCPDPLPYQPVSIKAFSLTGLQKLYSYLKENPPVLVHIQYWTRTQHQYEGYAIWYKTVFEICQNLGIRVIQNVNVPTAPYICDCVVHNVFVSNYVKQHFNNNNITASSVIYPGSDFSHFKNDAIDTLPGNSIGMVYRLAGDKVSKESIEVFIEVAKKNRQVKCYIIGDGILLPHYKKRVEEEDLKNSFIFTGNISYKDLPGYYKKFSVFVAPVHDESFGQVTPFAMSMGQVVAGWDIGALSEILGTNDTLVKYGDYSRLSEIILELCNNDSRRIAIGKQNQERAKTLFSVESMITQYEQLYTSVLNKEN